MIKNPITNSMNNKVEKFGIINKNYKKIMIKANNQI